MRAGSFEGDAARALVVVAGDPGGVARCGVGKKVTNKGAAAGPVVVEGGLAGAGGEALGSAVGVAAFRRGSNERRWHGTRYTNSWSFFVDDRRM